MRSNIDRLKCNINGMMTITIVDGVGLRTANMERVKAVAAVVEAEYDECQGGGGRSSDRRGAR